MTTEKPAETGDVAPADADAKELEQAGLVLRPAERLELFKLEFEPRNYGELKEMAKDIAEAGMFGCSKPVQIIVRVLTGRSLGLTAMQSLRAIYDIEGKPALDASVMHALCLVSPMCEEFRCIKSDAKIATYRVKRRGKEAQDVSFTIEEAGEANLLDRGKDDAAKAKNNWNRWRRAMLRARAKSNAARMEFPDVIMGMYSGEELRDGIDDAEIVTTTEKAPFKAVIHGAERDFVAERAKLVEEFRACDSIESSRAMRERIDKWMLDAPADQKKIATEEINAIIAEKKEARKKAAEAQGSLV